MGNCLQSFSLMASSAAAGGGGTDMTGGFEEGLSAGQVKIVLSRVEVEWLLLQLQGEGGRSLVEAIAEMKRERGREEDATVEEVRWSPSLERIMECPEEQSFDLDHAPTDCSSSTAHVASSNRMDGI